MNPANAIRFGNYLLGAPVTCSHDPKGEYAARLATDFSRDMWEHSGRKFQHLLPLYLAPSKWMRTVAARVLRRLRARGFFYRNRYGQWCSHQGDARARREYARQDVERDARITHILDWEISRLFELALARGDVRGWLLNAVGHVCGGDLTIDQMLRYGAIVEGRFVPKFGTRGAPHGN